MTSSRKCHLLCHEPNALPRLCHLLSECCFPNMSIASKVRHDAWISNKLPHVLPHVLWRWTRKCWAVMSCALTDDSVALHGSCLFSWKRSENRGWWSRVILGPIRASCGPLLLGKHLSQGPVCPREGFQKAMLVYQVAPLPTPLPRLVITLWL